LTFIFFRGLSHPPTSYHLPIEFNGLLQHLATGDVFFTSTNWWIGQQREMMNLTGMDE
jgi:hypothetical protein